MCACPRNLNPELTCNFIGQLWRRYPWVLKSTRLNEGNEFIWSFQWSSESQRVQDDTRVMKFSDASRDSWSVSSEESNNLVLCVMTEVKFDELCLHRVKDGRLSDRISFTAIAFLSRKWTVAINVRKSIVSSFLLQYVLNKAFIIRAMITNQQNYDQQSIIIIIFIIMTLFL
jgi:hypothetical protein